MVAGGNKGAGFAEELVNILFEVVDWNLFYKSVRGIKPDNYATSTISLIKLHSGSSRIRFSRPFLRKRS